MHGHTHTHTCTHPRTHTQTLQLKAQGLLDMINACVAFYEFGHTPLMKSFGNDEHGDPFSDDAIDYDGDPFPTTQQREACAR